jgi:hypothetical protein
VVPFRVTSELVEEKGMGNVEETTFTLLSETVRELSAPVKEIPSSWDVPVTDESVKGVLVKFVDDMESVPEVMFTEVAENVVPWEDTSVVVNAHAPLLKVTELNEALPPEKVVWTPVIWTLLLKSEDPPRAA